MKAVKVLAMARKEFIQIFRDFRSLYMAVLIPIVLIVLFGYALKLDVESVKTGILDQNQSYESRKFVSQLMASRYFVVQALARDVRQLQDLVDSSGVALGVVIPIDFTKRLKSDQRAPLQVVVDGTNPNRATIIIGYLTGIIQRYNGNLVLQSVRELGLAQAPRPVEHRMRIWFNEELESKNYIIPGLIAVIMMIVGAMMTSLIIAREWERGTMETLLSVPILPQEIVVGKILPYFLIGIFDLLMVIVLARWGFGIRMKGSLGFLLFSSAVFLYQALALGILISTVTKSQLVANQMGVMITFLPTFLLSGFIFPIANMPVVIQYITYVIPARYFISIVQGIYLRGVGMEHLWPNLLALAVMAVVLTSLAFRGGRQRIA